eukprot:8109056-Pyramimonas_sp.AAC.1
MVVEKAAEWGEELWLATLDVEKAFDRVHHAQLFDAIMGYHIEAGVVCVLRMLYRNMSAYVQAAPGVESRRPHVQRGVRQGGP